MTEALDRVGTTYRDGGWPAPCRAAWAAAKPQAELVVLRGHEGYVNAVCTVPAGGRTLLASADDDRRVRRLTSLSVAHAENPQLQLIAEESAKYMRRKTGDRSMRS